MPVPRQAPEAVRLYNELIELDPENLVRAQQIEWALRAQLRKEPRNPATQIALIEALLHQGRAQESMNLTDEIWDQRASIVGRILDTFRVQTFRLGQYERAAELHLRLAGTGIFSRKEEVTQSVHFAWIKGDFAELVASVAKAADEFDGTAWADWSELCQKLESLGIVPMLPDQQRIIRAHLSGKQIHTRLSVLRDEDDDLSYPELSQQFYVAASYVERSNIEDALHDDLDRLYLSRGLGHLPFWEMMTPMVMSLESRPSLPVADLV